MTTPTKITCEKGRNLSLNVWKWKAIIISSKQWTFPRHVPGTRRRQFWQPQNFLRQKTERCLFNIRKRKKNYIFCGNFRWKGSYEQVELMHFGNPVGESTTEAEKLMFTVRNWRRKYYLIRRYFPISVSMVSWNEIMLTPSEQICLKAEDITVNMRRCLKSHTFFLSSFIGNCFYGLWECSFDKCHECLSGESW